MLSRMESQENKVNSQSLWFVNNEYWEIIWTKKWKLPHLQRLNWSYLIHPFFFETQIADVTSSHSDELKQKDSFFLLFFLMKSQSTRWFIVLGKYSYMHFHLSININLQKYVFLIKKKTYTFISWCFLGEWSPEIFKWYL